MATKNKTKKVTSAKKSKTKTKAPKTLKAPKKTKATKSTKTDKADKAEKPSLESILLEAEEAFTNTVKRYYVLAQALMKAITYYGNAGKKAFTARFPLTDNAIRNLEYIGRGQLLPHFAMCSDRFVKGLVEMENSLSWQYKLLGSSKEGILNVRVNGKIIEKKFSDFVKDAEIDCILSIISESDIALTPKELAEKLKELQEEVRKRFPRKVRNPWEIKIKDKKAVIRFNQASFYTIEALEQLIADMRNAEKAQEATT